MDNILDNADDTLNIGSKTWNRLMDGMSKVGIITINFFTPNKIIYIF